MGFRLTPGSISIDMDGMTIQDSNEYIVNGQVVDISTYCSYIAEFERDNLSVVEMKITRLQNEIDFIKRKIGFYENQIYLNTGK